MLAYNKGMLKVFTGFLLSTSICLGIFVLSGEQAQAGGCELQTVGGVRNGASVQARAIFTGSCVGQKTDFYLCSIKGVIDQGCDKKIGESTIDNNGYAMIATTVEGNTDIIYKIKTQFGGQIAISEVLRAGQLSLPSTASTKFCAFKEKGKTKCIGGSEGLAAKDNCKDASGGNHDSGVPVDCSPTASNCFVVTRDQCSNVGQIDVYNGPDDISLRGGDFGFKLTNPWCPKDKPDCKGSIEDIVLWALGLLLNLGITLAILFVVYNGFKLMVSAGDVGKVAAARKGIWYAALGLLLMLIGKGFVTLILSILETLGKK